MVSVNLLAYIYIHFEFTSCYIGDGRETASELLWLKATGTAL